MKSVQVFVEVPVVGRKAPVVNVTTKKMDVDVMTSDGSHRTCCVCDQEDGCGCNDFKCVDWFWKIEGKDGSDYFSGSSGRKKKP